MRLNQSFFDYNGVNGVYQILNIKNDKVYIGSSNNINRRLRDHVNKLLKNKHKNIYLQHAFNKYGIDSFRINILEIVDDRKFLIEKEQSWIDVFNSSNPQHGYNVCEFANSTLGFKHSEETKKKMSVSRSGENHHFYGKKFSRQHLDNLSKSRKGENHYNYGNDLSIETKNKISDSHKGKPLSEEHKQKLSESHKGKKLSNEHKEKIRKAHIGKKHPNRPKWKKSNNKSWNSKLSETQVIEIKIFCRDTDLTNQEIAKLYHVNESTISAIRNGRKWDRVVLNNDDLKLTNELENMYLVTIKNRNDTKSDKLSRDQVLTIKKLLNENKFTQIEITKITNTNKDVVSKIKRNIIYKNITLEGENK
jgi:group I intron endonuclease